MRLATITALLLPALAMGQRAPDADDPNAGDQPFSLRCGLATLTTTDGAGAPNTLEIANRAQSKCFNVPAGKGAIENVNFELQPSCSIYEFFTYVTELYLSLLLLEGQEADREPFVDLDAGTTTVPEQLVRPSL